MKFRKKPVIIEAQCVTRENGESVAMWCGGKWISLYGRGDMGEDISNISITTLEGVMRADLGDWIICGVKGEFYPCKPDIFEATYETVGEVTKSAEYVESMKQFADAELYRDKAEGPPGWVAGETP